MNYAVVLAAGSGQRFGRDKLFELIGGSPLLIYSIQMFEASDNIDKIIIASSADNLDKIKSLIKSYSFSKIDKIIEGGSERQYSVRNALAEISTANIVVIHDAARPLAKANMISTGIKIMDELKASGAIPILPVSDTIKLINNNIVEHTVPRDNIYRVQTPQIFDYPVLSKCHDKAASEGFVGTDDASLLEKYGYKVACFDGNRNNIKVTYKEDLDLARYFIQNV